jgi:site-specific recombinase XerD
MRCPATTASRPTSPLAQSQPTLRVLFRSAVGRTGTLTESPLAQADVYRMTRRRASVAKLETRIGRHPFRATGITTYLKNGGKLEIAQRMAAHESARTTGLYDRRDDEIHLDEIERILI